MGDTSYTGGAAAPEANWRHWAGPVLAALALHAGLLWLALPAPSPPDTDRRPVMRLVLAPSASRPQQIPEPEAPAEAEPDAASNPVPETAAARATAPTPVVPTEPTRPSSADDTKVDAGPVDEPPPVSGTTLRGRILHSIRRSTHVPPDGETGPGGVLDGAPVPTLPSRRTAFHSFVGRVEPATDGGRIGPGLSQTVTVLENGQRLCTTTEWPGMFESLVPAISTTGPCGQARAETPDSADPWLRTRLPDDS